MRFSNIKIAILYLFALLFLQACNKQGRAPYPIEQSVIADSAMVVTAHPLASKIGLEIIKKGGNAVDATVASQFALAVVYPRAGNLGGGGFMVIRKSEGSSFTLDYREKAPSKAHKDMFLGPANEVRDSSSRYGHLASGVPGTVAGLVEAWKKYGSIKDFKSILQPSINLASKGYLINQNEADRLNKYKADFMKFNKHDLPFVKGKRSWKSGDLVIQKELAATLERIAKDQIQGFYSGRTAALIDSQMMAEGGLISKKELEEYNVVWREPIKIKYKDYQLISMPPPSSGGIALGQLLEIVENYPLSSMGFQSPESIHLMAEAERRVYADRAEYLGDSDFFNVPVEELLDSNYLIDKMMDFDKSFATPSDSINTSNRIMLESFETTHSSIVDKEGMAVSLTTTLNSNYGSKVWVKGAGFFMNNEMDDFSIKAGFANQFGLVGGQANAIVPGKRMLSSMTPTIVEKNGELFMVLGTPGGSTIITSVFQVFLNVVEFGMTMTEAVRASRFHHQCLPDMIIYEEGLLDTLTINKLREMGHEFDTYDRIGLVKALMMRKDGKIEGVGDARSFDHAEGF